MLDAAYTLYHHMVLPHKGTPEYQTALVRLERALTAGDRLDLEDAIHCLASEWGVFAFSMGLDLGMSLAQELVTLPGEIPPSLESRPL